MSPRFVPPSAAPDETLRRLYGRRRGRKLSVGRQGLIETLLPELRVPLGTAGALDMAALFPFKPLEIRLEIGFGAGEHLAHQAKANPSIGFIGCEPFVNGMAALLARVRAENLRNVRVLDDDVRLLFGRLPEASLGRVEALFPDPWPKTRHHRRRLIQRQSLDEFARILKLGGELRFATDHMEYARWTLAHARRHPAFVWLAKGPRGWRQRPMDSPETRYETKALTRGERCVYLVFQRVPEQGRDLPGQGGRDI